MPHPTVAGPDGQFPGDLVETVGMVGDQESARGGALLDQLDQVADAGTLGGVGAVVGDHLARRDSRSGVDPAQHMVQYPPADVFDVRVDAVGGGLVEPVAPVRVASVDAGVESQLLDDVTAFLRPPASPITRVPRADTSWPAIDPTAPAPEETTTVRPG